MVLILQDGGYVIVTQRINLFAVIFVSLLQPVAGFDGGGNMQRLLSE